MKHIRISALAIISLLSLAACAQAEKSMGEALEDISTNAKTIPENIWKTNKEK